MKSGFVRRALGANLWESIEETTFVYLHPKTCRVNNVRFHKFLALSPKVMSLTVLQICHSQWPMVYMEFIPWIILLFTWSISHLSHSFVSIIATHNHCFLKCMFLWYLIPSSMIFLHLGQQFSCMLALQLEVGISVDNLKNSHLCFSGCPFSVLLISAISWGAHLWWYFNCIEMWFYVNK